MRPNVFEVLLESLTDTDVLSADVIPWSSPVPAFGRATTSCVGTVGLNPSNREFVDEFGHELKGAHRRFETLTSLGIRRWSSAKRQHIKKITAACENYFFNNPYDSWFRKLEFLISYTRASFYLGTAAHLDLIPFATASKWGRLSTLQKGILLRAAGDSLATTIRDSSIRLLVLNGASVMSQFRSVLQVEFDSRQVPEWTLQSNAKNPVPGFAHTALVQSLGGIALGKAVKILGFNHNIQSSYGVTREVVLSIKTWIGEQSEGILAAA